MSESASVDLALGDFREEHTATILGWVESAEVALGWAEAPYLRIRPELFEEWHAERGVLPCVGLLDGELCAYGLVWEDQVEREAEVGRIIVAPERRRQGIGRAFVSLLTDEAMRRGFDAVLARSPRANRAAFACYRAAGFARMPREDELALNLDQAEDYVWLEFTRPLPGG